MQNAGTPLGAPDTPERSRPASRSRTRTFLLPLEQRTDRLPRAGRTFRPLLVEGNMRMKTIVTVAAVAALILGTSTVVPAESMTMMKKPVTIQMMAQHESGETGTAVLHDTKRGLVVTLHLKSAKGPQPAHIHMGSCAKLNPVPKYPLHNVVNGMSVTTIPGLTIGEIAGKMAVNVHKSLIEIPAYVSCGDVAMMHGSM